MYISSRKNGGFYKWDPTKKRSTTTTTTIFLSIVVHARWKMTTPWNCFDTHNKWMRSKWKICFTFHSVFKIYICSRQAGSSHKESERKMTHLWVAPPSLLTHLHNTDNQTMPRLKMNKLLKELEPSRLQEITRQGAPGTYWVPCINEFSVLIEICLPRWYQGVRVIDEAIFAAAASDCCQIIVQIRWNHINQHGNRFFLL